MSILSAHASQKFDLVRRSMIQSDALPMAEVLGNAYLADVLQKHNVQFGRADEDVYDPAVTLWAMTSQFLFKDAGRSCKAAAGRVVSLVAQLTNRVIQQNAGNFCRAKAKMPVAAIQEMALGIAQRTEEHSQAFDDLSIPIDADQAEDRLSPPVMGMIRSQPHPGRIINVDGFTVDAPDTEANQAEYPQNPAQKEGLGFPILRCVSLICMNTGLLLGFAKAPYSGKGSGEASLMRKLKGQLRKEDTLVADSYYCTYWMIAMCNRLGVNVVMKNHDKRADHPLGALQLSENERIETLLRPSRPDWMSKKDYQSTPKTLKLRLCDTRTAYDNARGDGFTIATTMLDTEAASIGWISSLYEGRWYVETDIGSNKCVMGLEHLRSQTPEGIERELWTGLLCYNLVRLKMLQSGYAANREIRSMSFTETYQLLSTNWLLCACSGVNDAMAEASQAQGACAIVGNRPGRSEPRENKRRPKILKLMTLPRKAYHAARALLGKTP